MKNNFLIWEFNYRDVLTKYYENFNILLFNHNEELITYKEFCEFVYNNTKNSVVSKPGVMSKQLHSLVI